LSKFAAIAMAATVASAGMSFMQNQAAAANARRVGAFNAQLANRDAQVAENNRIALGQKFDLELERAEDNFAELQSSTETAFRYRGVDPTSGTPLDVLLDNVRDFQFDREIAEYNNKIAMDQQSEIATFARMRGQLANMQGQQRAASYQAKAFGSLLGGAAQTGMIGAKYFGP